MPSVLAYKEPTIEVTQEHLKIALDQVQLGFWELDLGNYALNCTSKCKTNIGIQINDTLDYDKLLECILPEDRLLMPEAIIEAIQSTDGIYSLQYRVRHADYSIHWIDAKGTVFFDAAVPTRIIGTMVDITEKKDLELLRDELFNVTTHELKTPLSAVKGYLQLLDRFIATTGNEKITQVAKRALGSVERITRLLNEMADPANLYSNQIRLAKDYFDLNALGEEIAGNAMLINPDYKIQVATTNIDSLVFADRYRIGQVLTNLVNNAVKYSPECKEVEVYIGTHNNEIKVQVKDYGIGLAKSEHHKVFQKFYRASSTPKNIPGFGIGLFLSAEIIIRHGGLIGVDDEELANGTCFYFTLPIPAIN
ncbi:PAS domain-containing sensor histidine kinase [Mucilaginibacter sp. FT3.2]|uniref:PAS domain-containing sensor histidine kinase n=1 Tax=Mucilaginibacter sp. FT3.2 TaxID=2723090 RepID=UPI001613F15D|nr:PAS domain-containing sensor histidine kinase [Mucilaginibacter sp. FT3.2]MBB6232076.1 signal transduction histidine kinase [Mucilaginibacter sp. FT3.2]